MRSINYNVPTKLTTGIERFPADRPYASPETIGRKVLYPHQVQKFPRLTWFHDLVLRWSGDLELWPFPDGVLVESCFLDLNWKKKMERRRRARRRARRAKRGW